MFKKYAKNFLEKEVRASSPFPQEENKPLFSEKYLPSDHFALRDEPVEEEPEVIIGEGVSLKGEIRFGKLLQIDGIFEGELVSQGKLLVGPKGVVKANINLEEAHIFGTVEGDITVQGKLHLQAGATIKGNISAKTLCVEEGVSIYGFVNVQVASEDQEIQNTIP